MGLDFSSLRTGIAAGTSIPIDLMKTLVSDLNLRELTVAYGMSESSSLPTLIAIYPILTILFLAAETRSALMV